MCLSNSYMGNYKVCTIYKIVIGVEERLYGLINNCVQIMRPYRPYHNFWVGFESSR